MDEKTEQLRELFVETTEETTVTDHQTDQRGSLADQPDVERRLAELLAEMRDRYSFRTDLSDRTLQTIIEGYYEDASDEDLAEQLSIAPETVRQARFDLHLLRSTELAGGADSDRLRQLYADDASIAAIADAFEVSTETAHRYKEAVAVDVQSRRANHRYRDAFAELFSDAALTATHTDDVHEDGLDGATEGLETDVSF